MLKKIIYIVKHMKNLLFTNKSGKITWMAIRQSYHLAKLGARATVNQKVNRFVFDNLKQVLLKYPEYVKGSCIAKALVAITDPKVDPDNFRYINYLYAIDYTDKVFETTLSVLLIDGRLTVEDWHRLESEIVANDQWLKQSGQYAKVKTVSNHYASKRVLFIAAKLIDGICTQEEAFSELTSVCYS